jgi:hypothetical protein
LLPQYILLASKQEDEEKEVKIQLSPNNFVILSDKYRGIAQVSCEIRYLYKGICTK